MKKIKDMTIEELQKQKKMLLNDREWAGIGYASFYEQQIRRVNEELSKRGR